MEFIAEGDDAGAKWRRRSSTGWKDLSMRTSG